MKKPTEWTQPKQIPEFTMRKSEWEALGPKGQAAMVALVTAAAAAYESGALPDTLSDAAFAGSRQAANRK